MTVKSATKLTKSKLKRMKGLFGPPPVLASERHVHYYGLFDHYAAYVKPKNILELTLLMHLVDAVWLLKRYGRHQTVAIGRWYQENVAYQAKRSKSQEEQKERRVNHRAAMSNARPADIAELDELDAVGAAILDDSREVDRRVAEIDHNRALEQGLTFQEGLDTLINSAMARFNRALQLLEQCRAGLGQLLDDVTAQVIDAECNEIDGDREQIAAAPSIANDDTPSIADHDTPSMASDDHAASGGD